MRKRASAQVLAEREGGQMAKVTLRREGPEAALDWLEIAEQVARALCWRRQAAWAVYRRGVALTAVGRYAAA